MDHTQQIFSYPASTSLYLQFILCHYLPSTMTSLCTLLFLILALLSSASATTTTINVNAGYSGSTGTTSTSLGGYSGAAQYPQQATPCNLCPSGSFPTKPFTLTAVIYLGTGTCQELYYKCLSGVPTNMCAPIQDFMYTPCGCV